MIARWVLDAIDLAIAILVAALLFWSLWELALALKAAMALLDARPA